MASMVSSNGMVVKGEPLENNGSTPPGMALDPGSSTSTGASPAPSGGVDWSNAYAALLNSNAGDLVAMLSAAAANSGNPPDGGEDFEEDTAMIKQEEEDDELDKSNHAEDSKPQQNGMLMNGTCSLSLN